MHALINRIETMLKLTKAPAPAPPTPKVIHPIESYFRKRLRPTRQRVFYIFDDKPPGQTTFTE